MEQRQTPGHRPAEKRMVNQEDGTCKKPGVEPDQQVAVARHLTINSR